MGLSMAEANAQLGTIHSEADLRDLISQLDVGCAGETTLLYSGPLSDGTGSHQLAQQMLAGDDSLRALDKTEAAKFLDIKENKAFKQALQRILGSDPTEPGSTANQFLHGTLDANGRRVPNGAWDTISKNFVDATPAGSHIVTLTPNADPQRVFSQTELDAALKSKAETINGIPRKDLQRMHNELSAAGKDANAIVRDTVNKQSAWQAAQLQVERDGTGKVTGVGTRDFFAAAGQDNAGKDIQSHSPETGRYSRDFIDADTPEGATRKQNAQAGTDLLKQYAGERQAAAKAAGDLTAAAKAAKYLNKLGTLGDALAIGLLASAANDAYAAGDTQKGNQIVRDGLLDLGGGFLGGLAMMKAMAPLAGALAATGPAGALLGGALMLGAGLAGGLAGGALATSIPGLFDAAKNWRPPVVDPLILDLDGDGVETLGIDAANPTLFDGNADGVRTATGWVKADDGFLVLDRNGNGVIDNGRELFGDSTPLAGGGAAADGFAALAQEDTNNDGVVDNRDARFSRLRVWRDMNGDGISQSGELFTLADLGIVSLNTTKTGGTTLLSNGNLISSQGSYTRVDGSNALMATSTMNDVDLVQNHFISRFIDPVAIVPEAEALPDVAGAGQVRSLREAASLSPELLSVLSAYAAAQSREGQRALLDDVLAAWSNTSTMATTATGAYAGHDLTIIFQGVSAGSAEHQAWLTKLSILERFNGQTFRPVPEGTGPVTLNFQAGQMALLDQSYQALKESVYQNTVFQTRLKPLLETLSLQIDNEGLYFDATATIAELNSRVAADARAGLGDFIDMLQASKGRVRYQDNQLALALTNILQAQPDLSVLHGVEGLVFGTAGQTQLQAQASGSIMIGADSSEQLLGGTGHDILLGRDGSDTLFGAGGDDILSGGAGNDTLRGGAGNDVFVFNLGDGQDVIYLDDSEGLDTVSFGAGITLADLRLEKSGSYDLVINVGSGDDRLTLSHWWYYVASLRVDGIRFADGTALSWQELLEQKTVSGTAKAEDLSGNDGVRDILAGGDGNDRLFGAGGDDHLFGEVGNDTLYGGADADLLEGGAGNDHLQGDAGNDTLVGGAGNDTLSGGVGNDVFLFAEAPDAVDNIDRITDFTPGQDRVHLNLSVFSALGEEGPLGEGLFAANATGTAETDQDYILYNTTTGALLYDADGSGQGVAVQFATLSNKPELRENDFLVVG